MGPAYPLFASIELVLVGLTCRLRTQRLCVLSNGLHMLGNGLGRGQGGGGGGTFFLAK